MGIRLLVLVLLLALGISGFAQVEQPNRIEIELDDGDQFFNVVSAKDKGLIVFRETTERVKEGNVWEVVQFDTTLHESFRTEFPIAFGDRFIGYEHYGDDLFLLFNKGQYGYKRMLMLQVSLLNGDTTHFDIEKIFPIELTEFMVFNKDAILFGGYVNLRPAVVYYSLIEKKMRVLPGFYTNNSELLEINIDHDLNIFSVTMAEKMPNRRFKITIKTFDPQGQLIGSRSIEPKENLSFLDGRSTNFTGGAQFLAGTYANRKSEYSRGLYFARMGTSDDEEDIYYYNYADLKNFFAYMKAKREIRVKNRIERKKINNKKIKFNYRLMVHDIIDRGDHFIMLGEAYYPKYNTYSTSPGYFDNMGPGFNREALRQYNFAGYKYTHAVIIAFDKKGEIIWDNSFEINDVTSYTLDQFVQPSIQDNEVVLLYNYENVIRSKIIRGNQVLEGKSFNEIELTFDDDEVKTNDSEFGGLEKWYDDYFFAYGVQKIKNLKDKEVKLNRKVFFINKVIYQ